MASQRSVKITELPASTQDFTDIDRLVAVQPFGSALLTVQLPGSKILDAARLAGAQSASANGLSFTTLAEAVLSSLLPLRMVGATLVTAGYTSAGDGGGSIYKKVDTEPSHPGKFQDISAGWWELVSPFLRPEMFGAVGDGDVDDTDAIQAALDTAVLSGKYSTVILRGGTFYSVSNLSIPNIPTSGTGNSSYLSIQSEGMSFLVARSSSDNGYFVAPSRWLENSAFTNRKTVFRNIMFDANGIKDYAAVCRGDQWAFYNCRFINALSHGLYHPTNCRDGSQPGTAGVDEIFEDCHARDNGGNGWHFDDSSVDFSMRNCLGTSNTGWGIYIAGTAGCKIHGINMYGNVAGAATFLKWGWGTFCTDSLFDGDSVGDVVVSSDNTSWTATWGPNHVKNANLVCRVLNPKLIITGVQLQGNESRIVHDNQTSQARMLIIDGGKSAAVPFITWNSASPVGRVYVSSPHYNQGVDGWYVGRLTPMPNTVTAGYAPTRLVPASVTLAAATSTTFRVELDVTSLQLAGTDLAIKLHAVALAGTSVQNYHGKINAGLSRRFGSATTDTWVTTTENFSSGGLVSASGAWTVPTTTTAYTPYLTVNLKHEQPTSNNGTLYIEVSGLHRYVTGMRVV